MPPEDLAALDSHSPTPRPKRRYRRWRDEEKKLLISQRDRDSTIPWKEFSGVYLSSPHPTGKT